MDPTSKLFVVFYRPRYGNYQHWALYLQTSSKNLMFEVTDSHPNFERNVLTNNPTKIPGFIEMIFLDTVNLEDVETVQKVVRDTQIENETLEWDCQEYVLDILGGLERECVVDDEDEGYRTMKGELRRRRGPSV